MIRERNLHVSAAALGLAVLSLAAAPAYAQYKVKAQVDVSKPMGMVYPTSLGVAADQWDGAAFNAASVQLLEDAGITSALYPGNGLDAIYHFSSTTLTNPYTSDKAPYLAPEKAFPKVLPVLLDMGTGIVTVNYGSNLNGNGGGEPAEAAAWVAYANGLPSSNQVIGKDSKGNDWKTVGYWASLRAAKPLATDDGLNLLRIGHPQPFGIQLWAVGETPQNNGFYGSDHMGTPDLHVGQVPTAKDWARHSGDKRNGPGTYAAAVVEYVKQMKAVDPSILVGATLITAATDNTKNWNNEVLKTACGSMDFANVTMMGGKQNSKDWKSLDEQDLLVDSLNRDFGTLAGELADRFKKNCPNGRMLPMAITNFGVNSWMPVTHNVVVGLYAAQTAATLVENGVYAAMWSPEHSAFFLDDKTNAPGPAYYGISLVHKAANVGDTFVTVNNPQPNAVGIHAVKRRDGGLGLLLVAKDLQQGAKVTFTIPGYSYASKGTRYEWGQAQMSANKGIAESTVDGLSGTLTLEVPASGIVALVIPKN